MKEQTEIFTKADLIFSYSRAQAIADGMLVDVSQMASEAGIRFPVALTNSLWAEFIQVPDDDALSCQSIEGRLWDLLMVFRTVARQCGSDLMYFKVSFLMKGRKMVTPQLKAVCGPGDRGEPVITIMKENED